MRRMLTTLLLGAVALPAAAQAQSARELQRDRADIRQEQRELQRAQQRGDWRDVREQRGDVREARREYREDFNDRRHRWGANDWQNYRNYNRRLYARGNWRAPFRYNTFRVGSRIAPLYFGQSYWIRDPWRLRLPIARPGARWIRHYNDVILVDYRRGIVLNVIRNFYW